MRTTLPLIAFFFAAATVLSAVPADVTYTEGDASVRFAKNGRTQDAAIGDVLNTGDSLKTGADGQVELDQKGATLKINPGTVFILMERERGGAKTGVLSVALGSIKMRYDKLTGQEPMIQTASCAAGVRGTELTVLAGADGSSLIAVDSGAVEVEAEGKIVELAAGEGVEVKPGQPPGDKFKVQRDQIDYRKWNGEKLDALMADPVASINALIDQLTAYIKSVNDFDTYFQEYSKRLTVERQKVSAMIKEKGEKETKEYNEQVVFPLQLQTGNLYLNLRYNSLAALSMRRYIAARIYLLMKSRYINQPGDPTYVEFLSRYSDFLAMFEQFIVPHLGEADI